MLHYRGTRPVLCCWKLPVCRSDDPFSKMHFKALRSSGWALGCTIEDSVPPTKRMGPVTPPGPKDPGCRLPQRLSAHGTGGWAAVIPPPMHVGHLSACHRLCWSASRTAAGALLPRSSMSALEIQGAGIHALCQQAGWSRQLNNERGWLADPCEVCEPTFPKRPNLRLRNCLSRSVTAPLASRSC